MGLKLGTREFGLNPFRNAANSLGLLRDATTEVAKESVSRVAGGNSYDIRNPLSPDYRTTPNTSGVLGGSPTSTGQTGTFVAGATDGGGAGPDLGFDGGYFDANGNYVYGNGGGGGAGIDFGAVNSEKAAISAKAQLIKDVYDALYGDITGVVNEQKGNLAKKYKGEEDALTESFNSQLPALQYSFAGRGLADSSFKTNAVEDAGNAFQKSVTQLGEDRAADEAKLGQYAMGQKANIDTQKYGIDQILAQMGDVTDVDSLVSLRQSLDQKIQEAQLQRTNNQSQDTYRQAVNGIAPTTDRSSSINANLSAIIGGLAPKMLKKNVGIKLIESSGLPASIQRQMVDDFIFNLDAQDKREEQVV